MEQQEINEGYYLVTWPSGNANEPTNVFWAYTGGLRCFLNGDYHDVDSLCEKGYTFTPLVALTPDVMDALGDIVTEFDTLLQSDELDYHPSRLGVLHRRLDILRGLLPKETTND